MTHLTPMPAGALEYPTCPIQLVMPDALGRSTSTLPRLVAEQFCVRLGQSVISEDQLGDDTALAAGQVTRAMSDGCILLSNTAAPATIANINPNLGFNLVNDYELVGKVRQVGLLMVAISKLDVVDEGAFLNQFLSTPREQQYGSADIGNPGHLGGEPLIQADWTKAVRVPYEGEVQSLPDLISGRASCQVRRGV